MFQIHTFGHANILKFTRPDNGLPVRVFKDANEMDEHMIRMWNSVVGIHDRVYHLGDVVINQKFLPLIKRLNGKKVLIMGNHDIFGHQAYLEAGFEDLRSYKVFPKERFVCSHIPVHTESLYRWRANVHGHLHTQLVPIGDSKVPDPRYINVSVEQLVDYTPVHFDEIAKRVAKLPMPKGLVNEGPG